MNEGCQENLQGFTTNKISNKRDIEQQTNTENEQLKQKVRQNEKLDSSILDPNLGKQKEEDMVT